MVLISLRQLLDHAAENNYGVPAFNVNNLEQMRAIMMAADETNSPVIVQASVAHANTQVLHFTSSYFVCHWRVATYPSGYAPRPWN